jgi:hypothetical protein
MLIVETTAIRVETTDDGAIITAKQSDHNTLKLNETESAHLWRAIILQWTAHQDHIFR